MRRAGDRGSRPVRWRIGAAFCLIFAGCAGSATSVSIPEAGRAPPRGARPSGATEICAADLGSPDRRLTRFELAHAVEDVFGIDAAALRALPAPAASIGDVPDILVGRLLDTSEAFLVPYHAAVTRLAAAAAPHFASRCSAEMQEPRRCAVDALRLPGARLWRSFLSSDELAALEAAITAGGATDASAMLRQGIVHLLSSPSFYTLRNEAPAGLRDARRFAEQRLVSRMALVLWSSVPDQALLVKASTGTLLDSRAFEAELARMLADPRAVRFSEEFSRQWLRLDRRPSFRPSLESRELIQDDERLASAHQEVARFLARQLAAGRPIVELLTASDPELDASSASSPAREPGGLLTSRALLSAISTPIRGGGDENWLGRGLVVQSAFLCRTFPLAAVYPYESWEKHPLLDPSLTAASPRPGEPGLLSIRTTDKPCRECHRQLETIGAALDGFDGFGSRRAAQRRESFEIAGEAIAGPRALAAWILDNGRFEPCVAQKLMSYVLGRAVLPALRPADRCLVGKLTAGGKSASLRQWLWQSLTTAEFRAQGHEVIRDPPTPPPNSRGYTDPLAPVAVTEAQCEHFDAAPFLVDNCGTSACHGPGARTPVFAIADSDTAAEFLRKARPSPNGYCSSFSGYLDPENPSKSLVIRKLTSGDGLCGAPMPITGGPRTLNPVEHACFIRWVEGLARTRD